MSDPVYIPQQGDIMWLNLDPRIGHEQSGRRPVIVLSRSLFTERTGLAVVCPITSKVKGLPFEVILHTEKTIGAVLPIHVRSVDIRARQGLFIEKAPRNVVREVLRFVGAIIQES